MTKRVSRKLIAAISICIVIAACLAYEVTRSVYLFGRPSLGIMRGSASEADSKAGGFYLGTYTPTRRLVPLSDLSIIHVPDAWVEHAWKPELTFFFRDRRVGASGYYLYIPIHPDEAIGSKNIWPFKFGLELYQHNQEISRHPGIGYDAALGFPVFLDTLPKTVKFIVKQKEREGGSWGDTVAVETIEFMRAF